MTHFLNRPLLVWMTHRLNAAFFSESLLKYPDLLWMDMDAVEYFCHTDASLQGNKNLGIAASLFDDEPVRRENWTLRKVWTYLLAVRVCEINMKEHNRTKPADELQPKRSLQDSFCSIEIWCRYSKKFAGCHSHLPHLVAFAPVSWYLSSTSLAFVQYSTMTCKSVPNTQKKRPTEIFLL